MLSKVDWFEEWFDSPYYHVLYKNRDQKEADKFIHNLVKRLDIKSKSKILDLACGKGRHSLILNQLGMHVNGVDLSKNSINEAKKKQNKTLDFAIHDMREVFKKNKYNYVFNLFTSFGYFENMNDNIKMLDSISKMLLEKGILIIDFLNAEKVVKNLIRYEEKKIENTTFKINRFIKSNKVYKEISIEDNVKHKFTERVQLFSLNEFKKLLNPNFEILHTFGDFNLNRFDVKHSNRLIIIAQLK
ncbi:MAG: class I SAM-dependent methyltransferase [Crocinitomicaceae bacterium]|nr:class I SAM-dependent methyltransferase [Crocinitomicaceae bacterium]